MPKEDENSGKYLIEDDQFIGAIKLKSNLRFFHDDYSMWILNYPAYDDSYDPLQTSHKWRAGLLIVDESNAELYCSSFEGELTFDQIKQLGEPKLDQVYGTLYPVIFVVNFDDKIFVNGWHENIPIHEFIPQGWQGIEDDTFKYLPEELKEAWQRD